MALVAGAYPVYFSGTFHSAAACSGVFPAASCAWAQVVKSPMNSAYVFTSAHTIVVALWPLMTVSTLRMPA